MEGRIIPRERFRRSWLILSPEWGLAGGITLAVFVAAVHFRVRAGWEVLTVTALPIVWAGARTLQWACHTWTASADGRLIVKEGVLVRNGQVLQLSSVEDLVTEAPPPVRALGAGTIGFCAYDWDGQPHSLRWTWVGNYPRLREILEARGQLPVGRPPRWQTIGRAAGKLVGGLGTWLRVGWDLCEECVARLRGRWFVDDYGRFMAFAHHVLRSERSGRWPPPRVPSPVVKCWMEVLRQADVVIAAPNGRGWRVAEAVQSLEDIGHRLSEDDLRRAVQPRTEFWS